MQGFGIWKRTVITPVKPEETHSYGKTVLHTHQDTASVTDKAIFYKSLFNGLLSKNEKKDPEVNFLSCFPDERSILLAKFA